MHQRSGQAPKAGPNTLVEPRHRQRRRLDRFPVTRRQLNRRISENQLDARGSARGVVRIRRVRLGHGPFVRTGVEVGQSVGSRNKDDRPTAGTETGRGRQARTRRLHFAERPTPDESTDVQCDQRKPKSDMSLVRTSCADAHHAGQSQIQATLRTADRPMVMPHHVVPASTAVKVPVDQGPTESLIDHRCAQAEHSRDTGSQSEGDECGEKHGPARRWRMTPSYMIDNTAATVHILYM